MSESERKVASTVAKGLTELYDSLVDLTPEAMKKRGYSNDTIKSVEKYKQGTSVEDIIKGRAERPEVSKGAIQHPEFKRTAKDVVEPNAPLQAGASAQAQPVPRPQAGTPEATANILGTKPTAEFEAPATTPAAPIAKVDQTIIDETAVPTEAVADAAAAALTPKELAQAAAYAKTANISEEAAKKKLFGNRAGKIAAGVAATGAAAYGLSKLGDEPPVAMDIPSPLSDKGRQEYAAKAESKAASSYNVSDIMAPTLSTSKVGRAAPEAPDVTEENTALASELDKMKEAMKIVAAEYKLTKDQQAKAQLWEGLVNGMAAIAAGMYGMKHGLDMGGVKFNYTDWQKRADSAREDWMAGRMAAEKDYEMSKSLIEGKKKGKYDNWQVNQKLFENAVGEAERRDRMSAKNADLGMDTKRLNMQAQKMAEDSKIARAELMIKLKESGGDKAAQKALAERISDFDKTLALYGKNSDDLSLQTLKRLNGEISQLTGAPLVPESSFEGGWIGGPDAADIEASRTPAINSGAPAAPLTQGEYTRMMSPDGKQKLNIRSENVEKAKAAGWQILQN
jgi:hypothetical protein